MDPRSVLIGTVGTLVVLIAAAVVQNHRLQRAMEDLHGDLIDEIRNNFS